MKKHGDSLFQIGEVAKILGVTRKTLLVYENMGLLTPAEKDEDSGFRYYTADNMTQIRSIRSLQALGLSLKEVAEYYHDTENMDKHLERLLELRATLDKNTMRMIREPNVLDLMCCIPVEDSFDGPERMEFTETQALCIYYRGPYDGIATAIRALAKHIKENRIETTGPFRSIYLEGPPNRGENSGGYITQVAVPIKGSLG